MPDKDGTYTNTKSLTLKQLGYDPNIHDQPTMLSNKDGTPLSKKDGTPIYKVQNKIELFYGNNTTVAMRGKRHDGFDYVTHGKLQTIPFVMQDVLPFKVTYKKPPKVKEIKNEAVFEPIQSDMTVNGTNTTKITNTALQPLNEHIEFNDEGNEFVSISEFEELFHELNLKYSNYNLELKELKTQNDTLLSFKCVFPDAHSNMSGSNANAYAFKKDGVYVCKCHGMVCSSDYNTLNYRIKTLKDYPDLVGYSDLINKDYKVNLFKAYTGWGKTEKIADGIIEHLKNNTKLMIVVPNIDNIHTLMNRVNERLAEAHCGLDPMDDGRILLHYAEETGSISHEDWLDIINKVNIVITHHQYFTIAGDVFTWYPKTHALLYDTHWDEIYVDEGHSFIESTTTHDLEIGGLYKHMYSDVYERYTATITSDDFYYKLGSGEIEHKFNMCELVPNHYGQLELKPDRKWRNRIKDDYVDIHQHVQDNWVVSTTYIDEDYHRVSLYLNPNQTKLYSVDLSDIGTVQANKYELLTSGAESMIITSTLPHPESRRKTIGRTIARLQYGEILKAICQDTNAQVTLMSGTYYPHHFKILENYNIDFNLIEISEDMSKVKQITVLNNEINNARLKNNFLDYLETVTDFTFLYITQTINNANQLIKRYKNFTHNHNGVYQYTKDPNGEEVDHNVTVFSLESAVSKGYNFTEELYGDGFSGVWFDGRGVSPLINKLYYVNGDIMEIKDDYEIANISQAVGRAFRKDKEKMVVVFNGIKPDIYDSMINYFKANTTATILENELSLTNIENALRELD